jgi:hypothetical protein
MNSVSFTPEFYNRIQRIPSHLFGQDEEASGNNFKVNT